MELSLLLRPFSPKIKSLKYDIIDKKGIIKILVERNDKLVFSDIRMDTIIQQQKAVIETFAPLGEQSSRGDVQKTHLMGEEPRKKTVSIPCQQMELQMEEPPPFMPTENPTVVSPPKS